MIEKGDDFTGLSNDSSVFRRRLVIIIESNGDQEMTVYNYSSGGLSNDTNDCTFKLCQ